MTWLRRKAISKSPCSRLFPDVPAYSRINLRGWVARGEDGEWEMEDGNEAIRSLHLLELRHSLGGCAKECATTSLVAHF